MEKARNFLGYSAYRSLVRPAFNSQKAHALTENKWIFYRIAKAAGLPIPRTFGLFDVRYGTGWNGEEFRSPQDVLTTLSGSTPPAGLVLKPAGGIKGYDLIIIRNVSLDISEGISVATGESVKLEDVIRDLGTRVSRGYAGYIVQEMLQQHPFLSNINPYTANTMRVVTLMCSSGEVEIQFVVLRIGRQGNVADNWEQGGICVAVTAEGQLREGILKPKHGGQRLSAHPDTRVEFTGLSLPFWDETMDVCRRGARAFPGVRWIGWDILLTADGPVILEANADWDLQMVQVHTEGLLARPGFRTELEAVGIKLPTELPNAGSVVADIARRSIRKGIARIRGW